MKLPVLLLSVIALVIGITSLGFAGEIRNIIVKKADNSVWRSTDAGMTWAPLKTADMQKKGSGDELLKNVGLKQKWAQILDGDEWNRVVPQNKNVYVVVPTSATISDYSVYCISLNGDNRWRTYLNRDTSTFITSVSESDKNVVISGFAQYTPIAAGVSNLYCRILNASGEVTGISNFRDVTNCVYVANGNLDWAFRLNDGNLMAFIPVFKTRYYLPTFTKVSLSKEIIAYKEYPHIGNDSAGPVKVARVIESSTGEIYVLETV